jgi:hypothetical protein
MPHTRFLKKLLILAFSVFTFFILPVNASLSDGLILHYNFESISGNSVTDASGNKNNGTLYGSPVIENGYSGKGATFTNQADYLTMPQGIINSLTSFSVSARIKLKSLNNWARIFDFGSGQNYNMFLTPNSGSNNLRFAIKNGWGEEVTDAGSVIRTNEWMHVAVTFAWDANAKKGTSRIFVNGIMVGSNTVVSTNPSMLPQTTQNYIAKSQYPDPALNGTVDDFRIYDRALSDAEILDMNGYPADMLEAYNSINIAGDLTKVKSDLVLPKFAGASNYPVVWTSSSPDVISIDGKVTRPKYLNQTVTLTAKISVSKNGNTVDLTKVFNVTVIALDNTHWESIILETDTFKYFSTKTTNPTNWQMPDYNDASWSSGIGGFGFGDNDDKTVIPACNSVYLRRKVNIKDLSVIDKMVLDIDYDDAFILFINGVEAARSSNLPGTGLPAYNATLTTDHEARMYNGLSPERFILKSSLLKSGVNTFAIQVINQSVGSSDMSARPFISVRLKSDDTQYKEVPAWFTEPVFFEDFTIPIIFINTSGQNIIPEEKITANMKVINNISGINNLTDTDFEYDGNVGIKIRGNTSATFPKKSYTVETWNSDGSNNNVSLLGLPKENDWVFHGPYPDKSLMRNVLAYHLGNLTGKWSPRTRFFELYLNGTYQGVYVLVEKIKIDKNRCNLSTLKPADISGDDVTGGYILKIDRPEATDVDGVNYWISPYKAWTNLQQRVFFLFQDPDGETLQPEQFNYIKNHITKFEDAMYSDSYTDKVKGYYPMVDFNSFIDYYIISELSRNLDGYRISTFINKNKDSKGGKITMGPYWDYDICFGNANFFSAGQTEGWIIDGMGDADQYAMPFWWQKFRVDPFFNDQLKKRWNVWTDKYINNTYLNHVIDSCSIMLADSQKRNFQTWNILNTYLWPNNYVGGSYANEISYLKNWLSNRITWMNSQIQAIQDLPDGLVNENLPMDIVTYPNPFVSQVTFKYHLNADARVRIVISDLYGRLVYNYESESSAGMQEHVVTSGEMASASSVYLYKVYVNGSVRKTGKLIRN